MVHSITKGVKDHRKDCSNRREHCQKYSHRIILVTSKSPIRAAPPYANVVPFVFNQSENVPALLPEGTYNTVLVPPV
jgi:hypothetical protein